MYQYKYSKLIFQIGDRVIRKDIQEAGVVIGLKIGCFLVTKDKVLSCPGSTLKADEVLVIMQYDNGVERFIDLPDKFEKELKDI